MQLVQTNEYTIRALEEKRFFKLVCGASLTDIQMIENLSFIFALAGAHVIDLAPTADVIFAARKGIQKATSYQSSAISPLIMASIQLDTDPHFRKVKVNHDLCDVCGACVQVCPTEAFKISNWELKIESWQRNKSQLSATSSQLEYFQERCFGCGVCPSYCHVLALKMIDSKPTPKETLQEMILLGVKAIEFHFGKNYKKLLEVWSEIKNLVKGLAIVSFSIGSNLLSDYEIKKAANICYKLAGNGIILQCDGIPMTGGLETGNNMDNSCLDVARVIEEEKLPVYLQISGGTNQHSYIRAISLGININGVAIGSYARKLLMPYLRSSNLMRDEKELKEAVTIAKSLVNSVGNKYLELPMFK